MLQLKRGFTLIELMITLVVLGVFAAIAVPSFNDLIQSSRVSGVTTELSGSLALARSEAVKRSKLVTVCRANATRTACELNDTSWVNGWLVFADNAASDGAAPALVASNILRVSSTPPSGSQITSELGGTGQSWVRFNNLGQLARSSSSNEIFVISINVAGADTDNARQIDVGVSGRARVCKGSGC